MIKLSFIIPCYGSELTLEKVVDEIIRTVATDSNYCYEIILVNDCSPDQVFKVIKGLAENNKQIKGISLARNFGQHSALMAGFNSVTGDYVICLDDDGQTPAEELFKLVEKLNEGSDIVFAKYEHKKHNIFRNLGSTINDLMATQLIDKPAGLYISSYFACKKFVVEEAKKYHNPYPYVTGLLLRTTNKIVNIPVNHRSREAGNSGYTFFKLLSLWLNGFTAFSIKPLRLATITGSFLAIAGFCFGVFTIWSKVINPSVPMGYASLMTAVIFIGGMIMLMLGMIGEYLGRIYISINNSPQYVIKESLNL